MSYADYHKRVIKEEIENILKKIGEFETQKRFSLVCDLQKFFSKHGIGLIEKDQPEIQRNEAKIHFLNLYKDYLEFEKYLEYLSKIKTIIWHDQAPIGKILEEDFEKIREIDANNIKNNLEKLDGEKLKAIVEKFTPSELPGSNSVEKETLSSCT